MYVTLRLSRHFLFIRKVGIVLPFKKILNPYGQVKYFFNCLKTEIENFFLTENFQDAEGPNFLLPTDFKQSLLKTCCKMDWFWLIFRLLEAYFVCYKAIATYSICLAVCLWIFVAALW